MGHCLLVWPKVCCPKELGRTWHSRFEVPQLATVTENPTRKAMVNVHRASSCFAKALFLTAIVTIVGNGHDTFILLRQVAAWKLNHGTSPNLFATIPKRWQTSAQFRRPQLITDGLRHSRISQVAALWEYLDICHLLAEVNLQPGGIGRPSVDIFRFRAIFSKISLYCLLPWIHFF